MLSNHVCTQEDIDEKVSIVSNLSMLSNPLFLYLTSCQCFNCIFPRCNMAFFVIVLQKRCLCCLFTSSLKHVNEFRWMIRIRITRKGRYRNKQVVVVRLQWPCPIIGHTLNCLVYNTSKNRYLVGEGKDRTFRPDRQRNRPEILTKLIHIKLIIVGSLFYEAGCNRRYGSFEEIKRICNVYCKEENEAASKGRVLFEWVTDGKFCFGKGAKGRKPEGLYHA